MFFKIKNYKRDGDRTMLRCDAQKCDGDGAILLSIVSSPSLLVDNAMVLLASKILPSYVCVQLYTCTRHNARHTASQLVFVIINHNVVG